MTDHVPAYVAEFVELRRRYTEARDAADAFAEAEIKAEYARRRAEDKAAGRDTSGRSVATRRLRAYDTVMLRADVRERYAAVREIEDAYRDAAIARRTV